MKSFPYFTPTYIGRWAWQKLCEFRHPCAHWLCPDALQILALWLERTDVAFQWGSGAGTIWLAKRIKHLTSVEHDPVQAQKVQSQLHAEGLDSRVSYHLRTDTNLTAHPHCDYVGLIKIVADHSLDLCLVDGLLPWACCLASVLKLKAGGLLVLHHAERHLIHNGELATTDPQWDHVVWSLGPWRRLWTTNALSATAIFVKP